MRTKLRIVLASCACALVTGCVTPPAVQQTADPGLFHDGTFLPPAEPVDTSDLFALSPEMRQYLAQPGFRSQIRASGAAMGLLEALYKKGELKLDYDATRTRPAAATYRDRQGNCLSLVIMTAAFAKALNLDVVYQDVMVKEQWSRASGLYIANTHVNLSLANPSNSMSSKDILDSRVVIDFIPPVDAARQRSFPLGEHTIVAMYLNNRAGEALSEGRVNDAYWWARAAVQKDPSFMAAYNTLGVTYQKHGKPALAEHVYKRALEHRPEDTIVMHNLVQVLRLGGKTEESAALAKRLASMEPYPPFHFFEKGMQALYAGKAAEAEALFAREVRRSPYNHEFHFWLAMAHLGTGDARAAKSELAAAIDNSTAPEATRRYSAKLDYLRSLASNAVPRSP